MAHFYIRHRVQDYAAWKQVFDDFAPQRRAGGEISYALYHQEDDDNDIALLFEWDTMERAKAFIASDEIRETMRNAGVEGGPPTFLFLNAGDSGAP